ncbi:exopolysaccharide biosynthesis polyprenyl glycosylphosphotransferase [Mucilaginibacter pallidiroseus]|uniref:Exopolysaccharide biosynthesis polyprenyl glycosylphosphotransferase n=1 Tax=Mucilaginibacter pallidiroseus TaxID=2599295 RepID=A0A563UHX0_9SPHI|nr:exopolysaccharide biosynthesis polyprenyl glycosylphosphotransferase [Mucilaginibacter pallidiroseus]TWR30984.1 exopolysaccharide biosynthesis polyprenyl glycosylphosphotransferase [Mucilaginibacter pallidiroseus]
MNRSHTLKRLLDIIVSLMVIVFILSWLMPILVLMIKAESEGPGIFKQERSGRFNKPFWCYKLRSMRLNPALAHVQATKNDSRVTRVGAFIRKTSLDELPQFFNVLLGNMSLVGPRPHMIEHTERFSQTVDQYMDRHFLKPGITGWAQINGFRGEVREQDQLQKRVEHDLWYIENWSVMGDVRIIVSTVLNVIRGEENAY